MSEILERLRRLHGLREQKTHDPARPVASPAPEEADAENSPRAQQSSPPTSGLPDHDPDLWDAPAPRAIGPQPLHTAVPGAVLETEAGTCYVSTYAYPLANPRGDFPLGALLDQPPRLLDQLHAVGVQAGERAGKAFDYSQAAFIDTETSGLGTGSCCFMVGVGAFEALPPRVNADAEPVALHEDSALYWEGAPPLSAPHAATHFVVRQFFMRNPGEETALLAALATTLTQYSMTVTFNGRAFDLPLLRSRFRLHRHFLPASIPVPDLLDARNVHVDLLPPARRLWKRRLQSCRLINLEQKILNLHRNEDDVPGHLIPMLYVNFTRNGDARAMRQVFYHNREDIVSMVGIATHLATTITSTHSASGTGNASGTAATPSSATGTPSSATSAPHTAASDSALASPGDATPPPHGHEWLAMGQHYAKHGQTDEAITALHQATQTLGNATDRALAFSELAGIYKRAQDWTQACATWQLWISSVPGHDPTPYLELAKYCEWQSRELSQAEMWSAWALHNLQQADPRSQHRARLGEIEHRLARIRRKRATQSPPATES